MLFVELTGVFANSENKREKNRYQIERKKEEKEKQLISVFLPNHMHLLTSDNSIQFNSIILTNVFHVQWPNYGIKIEKQSASNVIITTTTINKNNNNNTYQVFVNFNFINRYSLKDLYEKSNSHQIEM